MTPRPRSSASCLTSTIVTGMPTLAKFIEMPPPIVPAPITPTFLTGIVGGVVRHVRDLPHLALGEEHVALRGRLRAGHQLHEQLALGGHAFVERQVHRRFDAADVVLGREEAAELARVGLAEVGEESPACRARLPPSRSSRALCAAVASRRSPSSRRRLRRRAARPRARSHRPGPRRARSSRRRARRR